MSRKDAVMVVCVLAGLAAHAVLVADLVLGLRPAGRTGTMLGPLPKQQKAIP